MKSRKKRLREVYVWELPVRIYHWLNALCIVILCITGFIIAAPSCYYDGDRGKLQLLVRHGALYPFRAAVQVFFFNFVFRSVLGVCRESVCALE